MKGYNGTDFPALHAKGITLTHLSAYSWLRNQGAIGKKIIVCYQDFMKWFKKYAGGGHGLSRRHARRVLLELGERGLAKVEFKGFGGMFAIVLFDLNFALGRKDPEKTKTPTEEKSQTEEPVMAKDQKSASKEVFQQQLILAKKLLKEAGINYHLEKDWWEIVSHGIEKIEATVEYFKFKLKNPSISNPIYNPGGWFRQALRDNYYLDYNPPPSLIERLSEFVRT